jgi:hypothetical protein
LIAAVKTTLSACLLLAFLLPGTGMAAQAPQDGVLDDPLPSLWQATTGETEAAQNIASPPVEPPAPLPGTEVVAPPDPAGTDEDDTEGGEDGQPVADESENPDAQNGDDFSMGDLPVIETVELDAATARRALDAYVLVSEKYRDAELENFENLQDFVDQAPQGRAFEADIKAAGFATVNDWNTAVTTVSFAYANIVDDQTDDIRQQIQEIKQDTEMAQDMRDRMVAALTAMIPSDNNRKIVEELMKDPVYGEKIKQLETEEE